MSILVGAAATVGISFAIPHGAALAGWAIGAMVFVAWTWWALWPMDHRATRAHAAREEPTQLLTFAIVLIAPFVSLAGVVEVLTEKDRAVLILIALLSVVASWTAIHTMYATHYARMFYGSEPNAGIDFHQDEPPRYSDFAYIAITVGMSFAISDTDIGASRYRRVIVFHSLLSYLFGTVIVALLINLTAGIGG
ncbi:MAG: DUF1345 domain-containing protein [Gordonia sp. (in: high G+C Gram-positive bacteria)]